jgi:hypothetical protein
MIALLIPGSTALFLESNGQIDDKTTNFIVNGTTDPNATVSITANDLNLTNVQIKADGNGKFQYNINIPINITETKLSVTAKAKDKQNTTEELTIQRPVTPLTINPINQLDNQTTTVTIEGKTDPQATVKLDSNDLKIQNITIQPNSNGTFKYTITVPLNTTKASIHIETKSPGKKSNSQNIDITRIIPQPVTPTNTSNPSPSTANGQTYVGSINSDVFHYPSCYHVKQIKPANLITFNSIQDAKNSGYRSCKDCNP